MPGPTPAELARSVPNTGMRAFAGSTALLIGGCLLGLLLVPTESWVAFFLHPLNAPEGLAPASLLDGVGLLRILLPICGLCWLVTGWRLIRTHPLPETSTTPIRPRTIGRLATIGLLLVLIVGVVVRIPLLDDSLWYDEIAAFWYYGQFGPGAILGNMFTPANHVGQTLATWGTVNLSGGSLDPIILRLPAVLIGLAACWPMWVLVGESLGSRWTLLGIFLLLICPVAVLEGTEARGYAFMLFFSTAASALMARYLRSGRTELLPFYALCCALGIWCHLVTVVVPVGHACLLVGMTCLGSGSSRRSLWGLLSIGLAALLTATLLAPMLPGLWDGSEAYRAVEDDQPILIGREGIWIALGLGGSWAYFGGLCGVVLVVIGLAGTKGDSSYRRGLVLCGAPIIVALILILLLGTWIYARFLVLGIPFTILAITGAFRQIGTRSSLAGIILGGLLLAGWMTDLGGRYQTPRQPVREIVQRIPDDDSRICVVGAVDFPIIISWYLGDPGRVVDGGRTLAGASKLLASGSIEWLVIGYPGRSLPEDASENTVAPGDRNLVEGFTVIESRRGWIDDDGSMMLLQKVAEDTPDQS